MIDVRNIEEEHTLENYARYPELTEAMRKFESTVAQAARHLKGRTVWDGELHRPWWRGSRDASHDRLALRACDRTVFSLGEYVPSFLSDKADTIHPAIRSTTGTASSPYMS